MINLGQFAEDKINIWFTEHPEERKFLDDFVEKNNLKGQSLGLIVMRMSDKDRERFTDLFKVVIGMSEQILKTMGLI